MTIEQVKAEAKKRFDKDLTDERAQAWLEAHPAGELQDKELENVAGGGCHTSDGRLVTTVYNKCSHFTCLHCGKGLKESADGSTYHYCSGGVGQGNCDSCKWCSYDRALWLCNHPDNLE